MERGTDLERREREERDGERGTDLERRERDGERDRYRAVSYTHLTLPTRRTV